MNLNQKVSDYIASANEEQEQIMQTLRALIHEVVENVNEDIKWRMPVFATTKNFAYFRFSKKHVTFGFYNIDKIEDPDGFLEGDGNTLKHVKIRKLHDIKRDVYASWLKQITS